VFRKEAIIDTDGTIPEMMGECKEGMDIAYNDIWGYAPLIVTLANTNQVLYLVNRPGNRPSCDGAAPWMDRAIDLVAPVFERVWLRGDTDFSLTQNFDRWSERVKFVFGFDAKPKVVAALAWNLKAWYGLVTRSRQVRREILRLELKRFLLDFVQIPCQIVATGRRLVYRILGYRKSLEAFFATFEYIKRLRLA